MNDDYLQFRTRGFWDTYYSYLWGAPERLSDELVTLMYDQNRRVRAPMAIPLIPANFSPEQANKNLEGVVAPTLVIWAMADPVLPPNQLAALTSRMTQAQLTIHELPTVGHFPALEAPELIIPPIEAFLAADQAVDVEQ
ncbi:MAG: alpha/beta hydrolase [Rhodospirillaceae bacterium]|nr:alpha/beta hydrolase [Rhodospirillaceae bacterium]